MLTVFKASNVQRETNSSFVAIKEEPPLLE